MYQLKDEKGERGKERIKRGSLREKEEKTYY